MAPRLVTQLLVKFTDDPDQLFDHIDWKRELDDTNATLTTHQAGKLTLTALEANKQFGFGDVTDAKYVIIVADAEVQVRMNDAASQLIELKPIPAVVADPISNIQKAARPALLFMGPTSVQSLFFTEPNNVAVSVYVALIGEAV